MSGNGRRQPTRSARTSTTRPDNYYAKTFHYNARAQVEEQAHEPPHGFFPAITHFTDGVAALPKEIMRHFTQLKESEGKAHEPDQAIGDIIARINQIPPPPYRHTQSHPQAFLGLSLANSVNGSAPASIIDGNLSGTQPVQSDLVDQAPLIDEHFDVRRRTYYELRAATKHILTILDEKNIVLSAANETLARQLARLDASLPYVEKEVSDEARLGSNTHWALPHMKDARKGNAPTTSRSHREVQAANSLAAAAAAVHETDIAAVRSEARREVMMSRKRNNVDSDFDERPASKRAQTGAKGKKIQDQGSVYEAKTAANGQVSKRRRIEKLAMPVTERAMSAAINGRLGSGRDAPAVPRDTASIDGRKRGKVLPSATGANKKRNAVDSPSLATSPTVGTFPTRPLKDQSPRPTGARIRQNSALSTKTAAEQAKNRPGSSASHGRGGGLVSTPDLRGATGVTGKMTGEIRSALKEVFGSPPRAAVMDQEEMNGALVVDMPREDVRWKREETDVAERDGFNGGMHGNGESSNPNSYAQTATTIETTEATPMARSRSTRGASNKNGAASSPALGASQSRRPQSKVARNINKGLSSPALEQSESEEERESRDVTEDPESPGSDEPRYCICNQPSYGSMVACDNANCPHEWFHLECVGLTEEPAPSTKWYCDDCKKTSKARNGRSNGR